MSFAYKLYFLSYIVFLAQGAAHASETNENPNQLMSGKSLKNLSLHGADRKKEKASKKEQNEIQDLTETAEKRLPGLIKEITTQIEKKAKKGQTAFQINFSEYPTLGAAVKRLGEKNVVLSNKTHKKYNQILGEKLVSHFSQSLGSDYNVRMEFKHRDPYADWIEVSNALLVITPK